MCTPKSLMSDFSLSFFLSFLSSLLSFFLLSFSFSLSSLPRQCKPEWDRGGFAVLGERVMGGVELAGVVFEGVGAAELGGAVVGEVLVGKGCAVGDSDRPSHMLRHAWVKVVGCDEDDVGWIVFWWRRSSCPRCRVGRRCWFRVGWRVGLVLKNSMLF